MMKVQDIHQTSSLPSILDSYVSSGRFEKTARVAETVTQMKKLQARKDKQAARYIDRADKAAEIRHKALLEQRHLAAYRRIYRLRDSLSRHYAELLEEKVQKQRQGIKLHDSATLKSSEQKTRKQTVQKLIASSLQHDDAYLKALPKTRYYLILELQKYLGQRGWLQGPREQEVLRNWVDDHRTAQLEKQIQQMVLCSKSSPDLKLEDLLKKKSETPKLPKIQVSTDESNSQQEHQTSATELPGPPRLHGKQTQQQDETELKFPRVFSQELKVPTFSTLQPSFLEAFRTNVLLLRVKEPLQKSKAAVVTRQKLHIMHTLSLSHMAHSRRLLDKNGFTLQYDNGYSIKDLLDHVCANKDSDEELKSHRRLPLQPLLQPQSSKDLTEQPQPLQEKPNTPFNQSEDAKINYNEATYSSNSDVPLSMEEICSVLLGEGFDDKMWTNYA